MANKYYYLASSLPYISFGRPAPVTSADFEAECRKWLNDSDMAALRGTESVNLETDPQDKGFKMEWKEFDVSLRRALAEARSATRLLHEEKIHGLAKDILDRLTPLDMEKRFEEIRWNFLEEKERDYHFDLNWLMIYCLKLKISERLDRFKREEGRRAFERACEV